jgi:hypothetical protein
MIQTDRVITRHICKLFPGGTAALITRDVDCKQPNNCGKKGPTMGGTTDEKVNAFARLEDANAWRWRLDFTM